MHEHRWSTAGLAWLVGGARLGGARGQQGRTARRCGAPSQRLRARQPLRMLHTLWRRSPPLVGLALVVLGHHCLPHALPHVNLVCGRGLGVHCSLLGSAAAVNEGLLNGDAGGRFAHVPPKMYTSSAAGSGVQCLNCACSEKSELQAAAAAAGCGASSRVRGGGGSRVAKGGASKRRRQRRWQQLPAPPSTKQCKTVTARVGGRQLTQHAHRVLALFLGRKSHHTAALQG